MEDDREVLIRRIERTQRKVSIFFQQRVYVIIPYFNLIHVPQGGGCGEL